MERVLLQTLLRLDSGTFTDLSNRIDEANRRARAAAVDKKLQAAKRGAAVAGVAGAGIACAYFKFPAFATWLAAKTPACIATKLSGAAAAAAAHLPAVVAPYAVPAGCVIVAVVVVGAVCYMVTKPSAPAEVVAASTALADAKSLHDRVLKAVTLAELRQLVPVIDLTDHTTAEASVKELCKVIDVTVERFYQVYRAVQAEEAAKEELDKANSVKLAAAMEAVMKKEGLTV